MAGFRVLESIDTNAGMNPIRDSTFWWAEPKWWVRWLQSHPGTESWGSNNLKQTYHHSLPCSVHWLLLICMYRLLPTTPHHRLGIYTPDTGRNWTQVVGPRPTQYRWTNVMARKGLYVKAREINLWMYCVIGESNPGSLARAASGLTNGPPRP